MRSRQHRSRFEALLREHRKIVLKVVGADRAGFDLWKQFPGLSVWLVLNGVFALALALLVYWLVRRAGRVRWLENNFAGCAVRKAEAMLEYIARFELE